ncbi:hypothetical protein J3454_09835 [Erythrobacter sp. NFXS35]|uniref:polysaccharide pyruvyl transferase family protein n=1 Tax=Erythrobacter sp. NFXS35 TaxID=2818436 RepID=UPI0032DE39A2
MSRFSETSTENSVTSIINYHRVNTSNIGDLICAPALWFPELAEVGREEILGFKRDESPSIEAVAAWKERLGNADLLIVGGGGLLEIDFFRRGLQFLAENRKSTSRFVLWGAGHNNWQVGDWRKLKQNLELANYGFDLVGVRDFGCGYEWVPCASCMAPDLDEPPEPLFDVVMYAHAGTISNSARAATLPAGMPMLDNSAPFEQVIPFLASGDLVLTDSFHGMYWATLMGRRVIAFPSSSKFYSMKHPVPLCDPGDWQRFEPLARRYPGALEECRASNRAFADKVLNLLHG